MVPLSRCVEDSVLLLVGSVSRLLALVVLGAAVTDHAVYAGLVKTDHAVCFLLFRRLLL